MKLDRATPTAEDIVKIAYANIGALTHLGIDVLHTKRIKTPEFDDVASELVGLEWSHDEEPEWVTTRRATDIIVGAIADQCQWLEIAEGSNGVHARLALNTDAMPMSGPCVRPTVLEAVLAALQSALTTPVATHAHPNT